MGAQSLTAMLPLLSSVPDKPPAVPLSLHSSLFRALVPPFYLSSGLLLALPNGAVLASSSWLLLLGVQSPDGGVNCVFQTGCSCLACWPAASVWWGWGGQCAASRPKEGCQGQARSHLISSSQPPCEVRILVSTLQKGKQAQKRAVISSRSHSPQASGPGLGPWSLLALYLAPLWEVRVGTTEVTFPICSLLVGSPLQGEGRKANALSVLHMTLGLPEGDAADLVWGPSPHPSWLRDSSHPPTGLRWDGTGLPKGGCLEPPSVWSAWDRACLASLGLLGHSEDTQCQEPGSGGSRSGEGERGATRHRSGEG